MSDITPQPIEVVVCNVCGEPWIAHLNNGDELVTLRDCIRVLQNRFLGPTGPPGPVGPVGILPVDPARTSDPAAALRAFAEWQQSHHLLSESADIEDILQRYWSTP